MKSFFFSIFAIVFPMLSIAAEYPPITLGNSELRPLKSEINGRPYQLLISYPYTYETNPEKSYPVLYVLDGYWDGLLMNPMYGNLIYDQVVPEFIIVGIGYSDPTFDFDRERRYDMIPSAVGLETEGYGGGEDFLKVIKQEIIPYIDENLRTDTEYRVLGGSSLGGFFTLYTMLTDTELFDAYIAISPAVELANRWLFTYESKYREDEIDARNHTRLPARLFMSGAEKEWTGFFGDIFAFDQILKHGEYEAFEYQFRVVDGEKHAGTKPEGYSRGIRFTFQPYLERQPSEAKAETE
jgi:uncharacterized protein